MSFFTTYSKKLESLIAAVIFLITFAVYFSTMAPTVSFWDTGEFIATSHILGVPHPPGSPLFLLVGKFFSLIPLSSDIAFRVNIFSPIISALTISLLFLICNEFIDRVDPNDDNRFFKMCSSLTASLTFAFTHSHWFNAVETEVYAFSGFMTALVVYLIMLWSKKIDDSSHVVYLMLISYIIGLATGLHLLNLLTIPFIGLIIYHTIGKLSTQNLFLTLSLSIIIFFGIQSFIIQGLPQITLSIGLTGLICLILSLFILAGYSIQKNKALSSIFLSCVLLIIIGYSTYFAIFIRSGQDPNIDENNPETVEEAISTILNQKILLVAAGRTDAGVHAINMYAHFDANINGEIESKLVSLLNSFLNHSISIKKIMKVIDNAHARFDAISRTYKYQISFCKVPFRHERYFELRTEINFKNIKKKSWRFK